MNLLFVSIAFPPKSDPECIQTGRYYKALKETTDWDIQVLTSKSPTLFMDIDTSLEKYLSANNDIIEVPIYETKISNFLLRRLISGGGDWPDSKFTFHLQWKKVVKTMRIPNVIYSRSFPLSSAIMAFKLANYVNVPWVLHLSDPWSISPIHSRSNLSQKFHNKWERKCFEKASIICVTTEDTLIAYNKIYPELRHKFEIVPNVPHEGGDGREYQLGKKLRIAYTGGFAGLRSPKYFLLALQKLVHDHPEIETEIEIIFAGNMDRSSSTLLEKTKLKCVRHIGAVSLDQSIELQQSSDVLLSIDNPISAEELAMFIPSKVYDYIVSNRRVLALTTKNSSTAKFLKEFKADVVQCDNVAAIQCQLKGYLVKLREEDVSYFQQKKNLPHEKSLSHNVAKLSLLLQQAISTHV